MADAVERHPREVGLLRLAGPPQNSFDAAAIRSAAARTEKLRAIPMPTRRLPIALAPLGRSLKNLVSLLSDLQAKGVDLFLYQQGLDTSTPLGRAVFQMLGVFSEFEAAMIRDRDRAGVARAKKNGTKSGKSIGRPKVEQKVEIAIKQALAKGRGILAVAKSLGVGTGTVSRIAREERESR